MNKNLASPSDWNRHLLKKKLVALRLLVFPIFSACIL